MSEILKLIPAFKYPLWGGKKLKEIYALDTTEPIGEAWTLSAHKDGESIVTGGKYDGMSFSEALKQMSPSALGEKCKEFADFPQLIKIIDTSDFLSVQVHPSDEYAVDNEGQFGKTEMWYILDAQEGAGIYYGLKQKISKEELIQSANDGSIENYLDFKEVKKGESYFVAPGVIHAIGKGVTLAEVQQNSNLTYRLYDFLRRDKNGNLRELHLEKAAKVSILEPIEPDYNQEEVILQGGSIKTVASCKYFTAKAITLNGKISLKTNDSFMSVLILSGSGEINGRDFKKGDSFFVPADFSEFTLVGNFEALISEL